jgi:hypothetical protein
MQVLDLHSSAPGMAVPQFPRSLIRLASRGDAQCLGSARGLTLDSAAANIIRNSTND